MLVTLNNLELFQQISLSQMEEVKLMNRTDTKFVLPFSRLNNLLSQLQNDYFVVNINQHLFTTYKTLYYDYADFKLYQKHHSGQLNRYKVRHRTYVESDLGFLEVKFKNNKGRTLKERIKLKEVPFAWNNKTEKFLQTFTPFHPADLQPALWVNYKRITLVGKMARERVTIDFQLQFVNKEHKIDFDNLVIIEVKQASRIRSKILEVLKNQKIKQGSISKYCLAAQNLFPHLKHNNFKEKIYHIHKIISHDNITQFASNI